MACPNGGEWIQVFKEGIGLVLGRWSALQHAIEQGWCKGNSRLEAQNLASNILSWFTHSKNLDVYDLETLLDKAMDFFKLVHQEGSVEEVERLREASRNQVAHPPVGKVVNADGDDDDSDSDDEDSGSGNKDNNSENMDVDNSKSESNMNSMNKPVNGSQPEVADKADDGWFVVSHKKNKGRKK